MVSPELPELKYGVPRITVNQKVLALRVIVWVILYFLKHTSKNFESQIFLISETVSPFVFV